MSDEAVFWKLHEDSHKGGSSPPTLLMHGSSTTTTTTSSSSSSLADIRLKYRRLDAVGYIAHVGAAICALLELMEYFEQINDGEGVLLLLLSRACREYGALRGAIAKAENDLEQAGWLCYWTQKVQRTCGGRVFNNLPLVALLLTLGGLAASVADLVMAAVMEEEVDVDVSSIGVILLALNELMEMMEESRKHGHCLRRLLRPKWSHALHSVIVLGAVGCGVWEAVDAWGSNGGLGAEHAVILLSASKICSYLAMLFDRIKEEITVEEEEEEGDDKSRQLVISCSESELV